MDTKKPTTKEFMLKLADALDKAERIENPSIVGVEGVRWIQISDELAKVLSEEIRQRAEGL